jgi:hypothetical protein
VNAEQWNELYPVGTLVFAYPAARPERDRNATRLVTRTCTEAQLSYSGTPVVWVDGEGSYICLTHVDPVSESVWQTAKQAEETAAAVAAQGALPVPVGDQPQPLDDTRLAEITARVERRFERCCERGQVTLAQLNFMTNDARSAVAVGVELLAEVERLKAELTDARTAALNEAADWFDQRAATEPDQDYRARVMRGAANDIRGLAAPTEEAAS